MKKFLHLIHSQRMHVIVFAFMAWNITLPNERFGNGIVLPPTPAFTTVQRPQYDVVRTYKTLITAYTSTVEQTDSTPCITANGFDLCENNKENVVATNALPFGTLVRIPEVYGDRIFTVQDRMNARYTNRMDIWMKDLQKAKTFGLKHLTVEVVKKTEDFSVTQSQ